MEEEEHRMAKRFCQSCGKEIEENDAFCQHCGAKQSPPQQYDAPTQQNPPRSEQQPGQPERQYTPYQPYPQYQPYQPQYGQYPYGPPPKKRKTGVIIGAVAAAAVVITAVILIAVLAGGGGSGGPVLTRYDYDDIIGYYEGSIKVTDVKIKGDIEDIQAYIGYGDLNDFKGDSGYCELNLDDYTLSVYSDVGELGSLYIDDFRLIKGVSKDSYEETGFGFYTIKQEHEVYLHEDRQDGYNLTGTLKISVIFDSEEIQGSITMSYSFDCDYAG